MGLAVFDICDSGSFNKNIRGALVTSGSHGTTTSSSTLTDGVSGGGSAVNGEIGFVLTILTDEDMRLKFGGGTPTATDGIILGADIWHNIEISHPGAINIIDVA